MTFASSLARHSNWFIMPYNPVLQDSSNDIVRCESPMRTYWPSWRASSNSELESLKGEIEALNRFSFWSSTTEGSYNTQPLPRLLCCQTASQDECEKNENATSTKWSAHQWIRWKMFSYYRRLFTVVFFANLGVLIGVVLRTNQLKDKSLPWTTLTAASVNLTFAVLIRNEHVINMLFRLSTSIPTGTPLLIRSRIAKIYTYGGIHSGCAAAAIAWYTGYAVALTYRIRNPPFAATATVVVTYITLSMLVLIALSAMPWIRIRLHNWFESMHRFVGWAAITMFWVQILMAAKHSVTSTANALVRDPSFWCLVCITLCVSYPWIRLRRHECVAERLSSHAIRLHFTHKSVRHCSAVRLASNPLKETHAFAAIPPRNEGAMGFSVIISNAGDWTRKIIYNPPRQLFIKSGSFFGVLSIAVMFKPVLIVATGSGIGPCLSLFHGVPNLDCHVLWSASDPLKTYGEEIVNDVLAADSRAVIVDTSKAGRPDLLKLTYNLWKMKNCEAVVIISNSTVTSELVYELEIRGIPAYGPIFDS